MTRTAGELASYLDAKLVGDASAAITGLANPESATAADLIYVESPKHAERATKSAALCAIARQGIALPGKTVVESSEPKLAFAKAAAWLLPQAAAPPGAHATAIIAPGARVSESASVGAYVVIEDDTEIGANSVIEPFCFVGRGARIGENCWLHPRVTLYAGVRIGNRVELHAGATIGSDGFGYVFGEGKHWKFPQIGGMEIGNDVEIGAGTTIDRGSLDSTAIGDGAKVDNLVHIAHNVKIGARTLILAQAGISGSCTIGADVIVGGQVGMGDHVRLEDGARVASGAGILTGKVIRAGHTMWGTPARPLEKFKEQYAWIARLPEMGERLKRLEERCQRPNDDGD
ncbi:MAG: UDP-3-O-(3-hydroxymyristoyl)glucosamine N-acyltransferase [Candidatus Acidiferrales bacterium]